MKAIVLAGGYAKRLWPLTKNKAKPLLPVAGKPLITYIIEKLETASTYIDKIIISTNQKFGPDFKKWASNLDYDNIEIVIEPTTKEEEKMGTIGAIQYVRTEKNIQDDCLIIAGDNLISFDIRDLIQEYKKKNKAMCVAYDVGNPELVKLYSEIRTDENNKLIHFEEKPHNPQTSLIAICCYIYPANIMKLFKPYIDKGNNRDSPGYFLEWLHKQEDVYVFTFKDYWFDIGNLEQYKEADEFIKTEL